MTNATSKAVSMEPVVFDQQSPELRGEAHGDLWRAEIHALADIRVALALQRGRFVDEAQLLDVAALHLPELERVAPAEFAELMGIARGAELDAARLVVLNHYTDLRDVPPTVLGSASETGDDRGDPTISNEDPGGCTSLYVTGAEGPVLAQTWDMHGTAAEFVRMVRIVPADSDVEILTFTLTGCLGMTGINARGLAVTINNLTSTDAQVGLLWPALVRRLLSQKNADAARDLLMATRLSSGHHYMIADAERFHGVETSGKIKVQTQRGAISGHLHTNHCLDPVLQGHERVASASTTFRRMDLAAAAYAHRPPQTAEQVWDFLSSHEGYPRSICSHIDDETGDPSASRTCGLVVMNLVGGRVLATRGCAAQGERVDLRMTRWRGRPEVQDRGGRR